MVSKKKMKGKKMIMGKNRDCFSVSARVFHLLPSIGLYECVRRQYRDICIACVCVCGWVDEPCLRCQQ